MATIDTVKAISDNLETILRGQGVKFDKAIREDKSSLSAANFPYGEIYYQGEEFEYTHGQRPGYAVGKYVCMIFYRERNPSAFMRIGQELLIKVRIGVTVAALNVSDLSASKKVSKVDFDDARTEAGDDGMGFITISLSIRYREGV